MLGFVSVPLDCTQKEHSICLLVITSHVSFSNGNIPRSTDTPWKKDHMRTQLRWEPLKMILRRTKSQTSDWWTGPYLKAGDYPWLTSTCWSSHSIVFYPTIYISNYILCYHLTLEITYMSKGNVGRTECTSCSSGTQGTNTRVASIILFIIPTLSLINSRLSIIKFQS